MNSFDKTILQAIQKIKDDILKTRTAVFQNANSELLSMYFRIGKIISKNTNYGNRFVESLSKGIKAEFKDLKGFSERNLFRMKRFYEVYKDFSILPPPVAKLPWSHNNILIEKEKDFDKRLWYAEKAIENG